MEVLVRAIKTERYCHSSTCSKRTRADLRDHRGLKSTILSVQPTMMMTPERNVPYAFEMMMEDGSMMKMISIGATSMEAIDGMNIIMVRLLNPQILGRAPEDFDTIDMESIKGRWMPEDRESLIEDSSGTKSLEEEEELEDSQDEKIEESVSWTEETGSGGSSGSSDDTRILVTKCGTPQCRRCP